MARYRLVPSSSRVWIDARSSLHAIRSQGDGLEGFMDLRRDGDGGVDLSSAPGGRLCFPVSRLASGNLLQDREMQKRIEARRFPTITGVVTAVSRLSESATAGLPDERVRAYVVRGDISFRGVTSSCEDVMTIQFDGDQTVRMSGQSTFDIRTFKMEPPRILMLKVDPRVVVRVDLIAEQAEEEP